MDPGRWVPDLVRLLELPVVPAVAAVLAADPVALRFGPMGYIRAELWKGIRSIHLHSMCEP